MHSIERVRYRAGLGDYDEHQGDVEQLLDEIDSLIARVAELEARTVRWEAMYEGMMAERDGYWEECDALAAGNARLRERLADYQGQDYKSALSLHPPTG